MSDNLCKWKSKYLPEYKCHEPPLAGDEKGGCILHSEEEDKDIAEFTRKVNERMAAPEKIDLVGCYFPREFRSYFIGHKFDKPVNFRQAKFSQEANFIGATFSQANFMEARFSQKANFGGATFSQGAGFGWAEFSEANFWRATFSKEAYFRGARFSQRANFNFAKFSKVANFREATFSEAADFSWATFSKIAGFRGTAFGKGVKFDRAEFMDNAFFLPTEIEIIEVLVEKKIREVKLGDPTSFRHTRFLGEVRFQEVDLRHCSFLHSNIDKVDFRYCSFGNKDEKLLGFIPHRRQNVLRDEIDADKVVGAGLAPALPGVAARATPTGKGVREEKYEPVRRLYLELKKNFEEKRDWNTAGDFHYGEMECRRKMKEGWLWRNILSLGAVYFWLSGYGERPLSAAVSLGLLIGICAILYMYFEGFVGKFDGDYIRAILKSGCDSIKITTLQRIGHVDEYTSLPAKVVFMFESIMGPILIALFALALRRKVKR